MLGAVSGNAHAGPQSAILLNQSRAALTATADSADPASTTVANGRASPATSVLGSGTLSVLLAQQSSAPTSGAAYQQGSFQTDFQNLAGALQSGDKKATLQAFSAIAQLNSGKDGVSFNTIGVPQQYQDALQAIANKLSSGDFAGAQQVLGQPAYQQGSFQTDFQNLAGALQSGDKKATLQAFSAIAQLNSGKDGVSFNTIGVPQQYQDMLKTIGDNLSSGDFAGAQQALVQPAA